MAKIPFMKVPGSDPSAVMKGDIPQTVQGSTAPGTRPKRPQPVRSGNFHLKREKRREEKEPASMHRREGKAGERAEGEA